MSVDDPRTWFMCVLIIHTWVCVCVMTFNRPSKTHHMKVHQMSNDMTNGIMEIVIEELE